MSELHDPTRESLAAVVTALVRRHGGPTAVSRLVSADRTRIHAWMKGDIGIDRLGELAYALEEPISVHFGPDTTKEPPDPPKWAEGLEARVADAVTTRLADPKTLVALVELARRAATTPQPSGADSPVDASTQDQDG